MQSSILNSPRKALIFLLFAIICPFYALWAQDTRATEAEVELERIFIGPPRKKILGKMDKAALILKEILKKNPRNHTAAYELARLYSQTDQMDLAFSSIKSAVALEPSNVWYRILLAELYQKQGKDLETAEAYEQLVKLQPENAEFYFQWAYYLVRASKINEAIAVYDNLEKVTGITEDLAHKKHTLYLGLGNPKKAARELERLAGAFPNETAHQFLLAEFYQQIKEPAKSRAVYEGILKRNPNDAKARLALSGQASSAQNGDEISFLHSLAPVFARQEVELDVKIKQLIPFIRKVAASGNVPLADAALELTSILENTHPAEAKVHSAAGDLLFYSNRLAAAKQQYERTLELDESVFPVWEQLLELESLMGDYRALSKTAARAMDVFPNQAKVYYKSGWADIQMAKFRPAIASLEQALLMSGENTDLKLEILSALGLAQYASGKIKEGSVSFEAAMKINANAPLVLERMAYALASSGEDLSRAHQLAAKACELTGNNTNASATMGWVLYKEKDFESAKTWLEKAISAGGDQQAIVLEHYGDVLYQLGDTEGALQNWQKAQEKGGGTTLLQKKIADRKLYE